jgi:hypothetical protein
VTFWLMDLACGACPFRSRIVHQVGEHLDYVCPRCATPINAYRMIGLVGK